MKTRIVVDSSSNLYTMEQADFRCVPLKVVTDTQEYLDDAALDAAAMAETLRTYKGKTGTSCPNVADWLEAYEGAEQLVVITITGTLSGSYNAAATARDMVLAEEPDRNIHLVNSRAAGGKMDLIFLLFDRYLASNPDVSFEDACAYFDSLEQNSKILFSLCNYENLAKAGRIPKAAGVIANKLNIRILGTASEAGKIELVGHTRGEKKMLNKIIDTMEAEGFTGGEVVIDHVENEAGAQALASRIVERWPGSKTIIMPCNGLDSYYAEMHGLIIGYGMGVASGK